MDATPSYDLNDYLAMARRHWWIVVLALMAGLAVGAEYNRRLPREFVASASVLVRPAGQDANVSGGRTRDEINLDTEAQLMRSTAVVERVAAALKRTDSESLAGNVLVEVPPNTSVLLIKFSAPKPREAQAGARAFAESYLANRNENAKASITSQTESLQAKLAELTADLNRINGQLMNARPASSAYATLDSQRDTAVSQINQLTNKINQLTTETVSGGTIIRDARLPGRPIKPNTPINLAAGALLGLLFGIAGGGLRERLDQRVRGRGDVLARCGVPVLGEVNDKTVPLDDVFAPFSPGGRAFNRLRNEVVAALTPGEKVVVVTGASRGPAATLVAANLAAALARTGTNVVLVGAHGPDSMMDIAPLARLLGVTATAPGLSDVLAGRANLGEATQRAARNPTLRVITAGGTGSAAGLLQSQTLRDMVSTLRGNADYLVIEAPSTATGADAQSLASLADAAILAVEVRRTVRPEVCDAAEQLRRVGTPLLGAVLTPKLKHSGGKQEPQSEPAPVEEKAELEEPAMLNGHQPELPQDQTVLMSTLDSETIAALDEAHRK
ncbi:MAG TPA: lipopolysaccharide biosynthesis protein [Micromonosporaceae bacterium]|nr:lipopolysaccharide biosynthesis protein [Micromonosporaceae bacterium]